MSNVWVEVSIRGIKNGQLAHIRLLSGKVISSMSFNAGSWYPTKGSSAKEVVNHMAVKQIMMCG